MGKGNAYCKECGVEFQCNVDNPDCLCDHCWGEKYAEEDNTENMDDGDKE